MQTGIDFSSGKWLLNGIDSPYKINDKLTKLAINDFDKLIRTNLNYAPVTKGLLLPKNIPFNPNLTELKNLKLGNDFDYFINLKAKVLKDEIGVIDFTVTNSLKESYKNEVEIEIEIYDLNNSEIIYSKTIKGSVEISKNSQDFYIAKTTDGLILGAYKKLIRDINKKSI
ncbi:hypothetical protein [Flavobacterium defluvii]|nr:hypothetical protein [Flavobacterium defluvii]